MARASDPAKALEVAKAIVRRLRAEGHTAYFAGGCVRDALLGLRPTDFDVATDATPDRVQALFDRTAAVGAAFGVVLVSEYAGSGQTRERITVEVATFRSDGPYTDARRPDSVHFSDPAADAARRDFTINALFLDPLSPPGPEAPNAAGQVIDLVGGMTDLRAKVIRAVGDPEARLAEDHLRALRAVRFAARLGFQIESATASAIRRHAAELRGVSRERIGEELKRMFAHPARADSARLLQELSLDGPVLNEPTRQCPTPLLEGLAEWDGSPVLSLVAWALDRAGAAKSGLGDGDIGRLVKSWRVAMTLSNEDCEELEQWLRGHQYLIRAWGQASVARRKRWAAAAWFRGAWLLVKMADADLATRIRGEVEILEHDGTGLAPVRYISGNDLIAAGFKPGPLFRRVLEEVYDAQLEGKVRSRDEAMELARGLDV